MEYDLCIIGAGTAGLSAALCAAQLGKKVCLIEQDEPGGTCLNRGCIPSKLLIHHSKKNTPLSDILKKKMEVLGRLRAGMIYLVKSNSVDYLGGSAAIDKSGRVVVEGAAIASKFILLASGSVPKELSDLKFDHKTIISSDDALMLEEAPRKLLIVGGGAVGCEFAFIFARLGSSVALIEAADQILPGVESEAAKKVFQSLQKTGVAVFVKKSFRGFDMAGYDKVLVCVGRQPHLEGVCSVEAGVKIEGGFISVDERLRTAVPHIFAAGDCIGYPMLAHVASYEGELAVRNMFSRTPAVRDYSAVPNCVFTTPEVASIGLTEEAAAEQGLHYKAQTVSFLAVGMAHVLEETQGFVKAVVEVSTKRILGATVVGGNAEEIINMFSLIMRNRLSLTDVRNTMFFHPSLSEIVSELAKSFTPLEIGRA